MRYVFELLSQPGSRGGVPRDPGKCCGPVSFLFFKSLFFLFVCFLFSFLSFFPFFSFFSFLFYFLLSRGLYLRYTFVANPIQVPVHECAPAVHFCGESGPGPKPMCDMLRLVCGGLVGGSVGRLVSGRKTKNRTFQGCGKTYLVTKKLRRARRLGVGEDTRVDDVAELGEVGLEFLRGGVSGQATHEDLAGRQLRVRKVLHFHRIILLRKPATLKCELCF